MGVVSVFENVATNLPGVTCWLGAEHTNKNDAPPRIVWVPVPESYEGAMRIGAGIRAPHSVKTRIASLELHIWAAGDPSDTDINKDMKAAEALINRVIIAIHKSAWGSYRIGTGRWMDRNVGTFGLGYMLQVALLVPVVPADADNDATVTTFTNVNPMNGTMDFPASDATGEPAP